MPDDPKLQEFERLLDAACRVSASPLQAHAANLARLALTKWAAEVVAGLEDKFPKLNCGHTMETWLFFTATSELGHGVCGYCETDRLHKQLAAAERERDANRELYKKALTQRLSELVASECQACGAEIPESRASEQHVEVLESQLTAARGLLERVRPLIEKASTELLSQAEELNRNCQSYGGFCGGDPRDFHPDPECSTEEERVHHKAACEAWDRGERPEFKDRCGFQKVMDGTLPPDASLADRVKSSELGGHFGLGTTIDPDAVAEVERQVRMANELRALLAELDAEKGEGPREP